MAQIMAQLPGIARSCPLAPPQLLHQDMSRLHRQRNACRPFQSTRGQAGRRTSAVNLSSELFHSQPAVHCHE